MIISPKDSNAHLASAWTAGVAALFLAIGFSGAVAPLLPENPPRPLAVEAGDLVMLEEFAAPPSPATEETTTEPAEAPPEQEMEIPPVPEITPPLTPPEMTEITPLDAVTEKPKPPSAVKLPVAKPRPAPSVPATRPTAPAGNPGTQPGTNTQPVGKPGGTGKPSAQNGSGKGSFPLPRYPAAARRDGLQGNVKLSVTVEASGLPGSVSVVSSSGHAILDAAARDHVQRRYRWPAGGVRHFVVPLRYLLQ